MSIGIAARSLRLEPARVAIIVVTALAGLVIVEAIWLIVAVIGPDPSWSLGMDFRYYRDLGVRWLADGSFYLPRQLEGPYVVGLLEQAPVVDTQYPPHALLLFVPFAFLPAGLWWAIPIGVVAFALWRCRPAPWAMVLMLALLAWPRAIGAYLFGNTDIWMAAGVAAGLMWGWPVLILTMKPTLGMFALLGVRRGSWWLAAGLGMAFVVVSWPLWLDYVTSLRNARGVDLGYSLGSLPLMTIPIVAWIARRASVDTRERLGAVPDPQEVERGSPTVRVVRGEPHAD